MSTPSGTPSVFLPDGGRRRLVRGAIVTACVLYVGILLLLPLAGIIYTALEPGLAKIWETFSLPDVRHAFYLTGVITVITLIVTTFFGVLTSWVLVRQTFPGKSLLNAIVDLPFALSPVTVGLAAVILFGRGGWLEGFFQARGVQIIFALPSMVLVTIFICIPFTIREVVPVLEEIGKDEEDAARTLGASILQTWRKVTMPNIRWGLLYGVALTTARAIGEIGAVLIVSGLIKGKTETATLFIFTAIEERMYSEAYIVALTLAAVSIVVLVTIETTRHRIEGRKGRM
jgi:sulfate/thiosulfate transport system permease protein